MTQFLANVYAALPGGIMVFVAFLSWMWLFHYEELWIEEKRERQRRQ